MGTSSHLCLKFGQANEKAFLSGSDVYAYQEVIVYLFLAIRNLYIYETVNMIMLVMQLRGFD